MRYLQECLDVFVRRFSIDTKKRIAGHQRRIKIHSIKIIQIITFSLHGRLVVISSNHTYQLGCRVQLFYIEG
jgi:hypothetical protein